MSDKEERILIIPCRSECNCIRPVGNELYCGAYIHSDWVKIDPEKDCKNCKHAQYNGISRAEAVERMAKVVFQKDNVLSLDIGFDKLEQRTKNFYLKLAEAALDALVDK